MPVNCTSLSNNSKADLAPTFSIIYFILENCYTLIIEMALKRHVTTTNTLLN